MQSNRSSNTNTNIYNYKPNTRVETTKVFTPNLTDHTSVLSVNKQTAVPIIESISKENNKITTEIKQMGDELKKLSSLG